MSAGALMAAEIAEQPRVITGLLARGAAIGAAVDAVRPPMLRGFVLVARGSSDHAAIYGRYVLEHATGCPVALAAPSLHTRYGVVPELGGFLAVGVSQSGRTPEVAATMQILRAGGARTVAICNDETSPLAAVGDVVVQLGAGEERAVPATKTFTAQLAAFALIAQTLARTGWAPPPWGPVLDALAAVVADDSDARTVADRLSAAERLVQVGRAFLYPVALEAGLKISETTGLVATGYSPHDLLHGPIAAASAGVHALCFSSPGPVAADVAAAAAALTARGAGVVAIAEHREDVPGAGAFIGVPAGTDELLAPIVYAVRAQQLALHLAVARGVDPDRPFGLTKVTRTA